MKVSSKSITFWATALSVLVLDFITKQIAEANLQRGQPVDVLGDLLRFTLGYNTGIAFGLSLGETSRWVLVGVTIATMALIFWLFRSVDARHKLQILAFGLIMGGAAGNLLDRIFGSFGVIDFIDVGIGVARFWTFNIADSAITVGAVLLVLASLFEHKEAAPTVQKAGAGSGSSK
ncbi:MAG TPA: signal peptidase II [Longimicrobiales bacterium]|nr:signal peptidase II [Longimicrobiales bacterium]